MNRFLRNRIQKIDFTPVKACPCTPSKFQFMQIDSHPYLHDGAVVTHHAPPQPIQEIHAAALKEARNLSGL